MQQSPSADLGDAACAAVDHGLNAACIPWARLNYVQESVWQQEMDCGITDPLSIFLCLWLRLHHWSPNVKIYFSCRDECCCLPHPSPSHLLFLFPAAEAKGRRTGRSRYSCDTRSAATGWGTTSTSTCTSALHRVGTGGSTHPMRSPVTVRNQPPFSCADPGKLYIYIYISPRVFFM